MKFVAQIATNQKKLIPVDKVIISQSPKRIQELSLKKIWPIVCQNNEILQYLPDIKQNCLPPRDFFFKVFASVQTEMYYQMLEEASAMRKQKMQDQNQMIQVNQNFMVNYRENQDKYYFGKKKQIKKFKL